MKKERRGVGEWLLIYTHTTSRALLVQTYTYTRARARTHTHTYALHYTPSEPILNDDGSTHSVRRTTKKDYLEAFLSFFLPSFLP